MNDDLKRMLNDEKTIKYSNLPNKLLVATGYKLYNLEGFLKFGKVRNSLIHTGIEPKLDRDYSLETIKFCFEIDNPLVEYFWHETLFDFVCICI